MANEMIERVAAAIEKALREGYFTTGSDGMSISRHLARAAIAAMREPTEAMNDAGYAAACQHDYGESCPSLEIAPATFRAMIDAALSESNEG